ncbi:MAG: hypothetical protein IJI96_02640 [Methanobrevibacter sp.]|nr:hypothetical protein [Methanobrevibacter sp.]MBQ6627404.1 hypothetical protein [Methanobrevibacter sp.]
MEAQLYFACLNYCQAFGHLLFEEGRIRRPDIDPIEKLDSKRMIKMEKERLNDCFYRLKEVIIEIDKELKG